MFFILLIFQPSDFITNGIIEGIHLRLKTRVVTREGFPLLGEIILLFALPFRLNISVHDGILDIVNILLDFPYRLLGRTKTFQFFIDGSNPGLGRGDAGGVGIHLALKRILFKARVYQWFIGKLFLHLFYHKRGSYLLFCDIIPEGG